MPFAQSFKFLGVFGERNGSKHQQQRQLAVK